MRIIFNLMGCSLGNNGGSLTIIKSANTLLRLGHDVEIADTARNQNSWIPLLVKHRIVKNINDIENADVIIATGYDTVKTTLEYKKNIPKYHWIRAFETWKMNESKIIEKIMKPSTKKIVNSICLKNKFLKYGFDSEIIRPGNDFDIFYPMNIRKDNKKIIIGGLYNNRNKEHRGRKRVDLFLEVAKKLKDILPDKIEIHMMGDDILKEKNIVDFYLKSPSEKEKNKFFNRVDIWVTFSCSEGLHIPPQEAMLSEACVVGVDEELAGTQDYLINDRTGIVLKSTEIDYILTMLKILIFDSEQRNFFGKTGRKKILELGDREENMKKLINIFERDMEKK
ncbi:MAG: Glycosyl transferases group 1 [candidate division CPR1 bacterium ADurb.Bin160]|uniref:Glycosyl transferases group 1 n=1 Tax=candidate division CPR1 bacterium ADurb.Bin160 TaxID=1852826 RepID=A0A1V5ZM28_9BACT|nr:MAG: Glycosyl transferases group 1 [candidate division CPR1 bacterium ADurb.Bin160]